MSDQSNIQAVITEQAALDPSQAVQELAIFNPDGTPASLGGGGIVPAEASRIVVGAENPAFGATVTWQLAMQTVGTGFTWEAGNADAVVVVEDSLIAVTVMGMVPAGLTVDEYQNFMVAIGGVESDLVGSWYTNPVPSSADAHQLSGTFIQFAAAGAEISVTPTWPSNAGTLDIVYLRVQQLA